MSIPKSPCKDCADRTVGCHSNCEQYAAFKKEHDEVMSEVNIKFHADCASSYFLKGKRKRFRAFGKKGKR